MTRDELDEFLATLYAPREHKAADQQRERERDRNLTDAEMVRWRAHFHDLIAQERAATEAGMAAERAFLIEVVGGALGEMRLAIETGNKQSIETALAPVQASLATLHQDMAKRAGVEVGEITELPNPIMRRHGNAAS